MTSRKPKPFVAMLLAFGSPGLGHLYLGRRRSFFVALGLFPVLVAASFLGFAYLPGAAAPGLAALLILVWLIAWPAHANRVALDQLRSPSPSPPTGWPILVVAVLATAAWLEVARSVLPYHTYRVTSGNMEPTLVVGDHFVTRSVSASRVQRHDIVMYSADDMPGVPIVGRVVALGGDVVQMTDGTLSINGEVESASYVRRSDDNSPYESRDWGPIQVPDEAAFILGDHRNMSIDSRERGPIMLDAITDVAMRIHFSVTQYRMTPRWDRVGRSLR